MPTDVPDYEPNSAPMVYPEDVIASLWEPFGTAHKSGDALLAFTTKPDPWNHRMAVIWWENDRWVTYGGRPLDFEPDNWMPLPPIPRVKQVVAVGTIKLTGLPLAELTPDPKQE